MNSHLHAFPSQIIRFITFLVVFGFPICFSSNLEWYDTCGNYFSCGKVTHVGFPFWGGTIRPKQCGHPDLELSCKNNVTTLIQIKGMRYHVLDINQNTRIMKLARDDFLQGICMQKFVNTTLDFELFDYAPGSQNLTVLYGCPPPYTPNPSQFTCKISVSNDTDGYPVEGAIGPSGCYASVVVPVLQFSGMQIGKWSTSQIIAHGFEATYKVEDAELCAKCEASRGRCGYDFSEETTTCLCSDGSVSNEDASCSSSTAAGKTLNKGVVIGASVAGILVFAVLFCGSIFFVRRRKQSRALSQALSKDLEPSDPSTAQPFSNGYSSQGYTTTPSTYMSQSIPSYSSSKSDFEKSADYFGVKVFSYNELEEATQNFHESQELGDGGFGTVYYGKLDDGSLVAVKRLYENSCRHMGQFLNEIHILARLRHKNLVALYGCTSRKSRELLLVYEYVPNGTVADHLHGKLAQSSVLPWSTRLSIAVETAEALSFLHENDVIHRDVKTTNILLESSFRVKVADFGLSRLFPNDVTHVSTAPQGTPGYVDPEYYQCYQLTEKSDVYSFGVVLAELISSKVAVDITRHRHDINLANMAVDRIYRQALDELIDPKLGSGTDFLAQKMMKLVAEVAFQCLQKNKDERPTMKEVLESLKGIQKEMENAQKQVVVDIHESDDDVGLLKNVPPPLSPETEVSIKSIR